jgi:N-methylhydantoinase A
MSGPEKATIGVDVGGTHTDVCAMVDGRLERGKALTTYDDFSRGVLQAVEVAAAAHGLSLGELLAATELFINGTTVVTNSITTLQGARVGVVITHGFRDTFRFAGGPRLAAYDDHLQHNAPDIVARSAIAEVDERVNWSGEELAPLNREQLLGEVDRLVDEEKVEAIAVCFLNSFRNPDHEAEAKELIAARHPDLFVSLSHEVFPVIGENRRWTTAVLNCFVQKRATEYLDSLSGNLERAGLTGRLVFFQGLGGVISLERAKQFPLVLLGSGPAGGAIGANALAERMGSKNVLLGDMGGTSFDTGIIVDNEIAVAKNLDLGLLRTGVNVVDVVSVGAGGGSIAWVGERNVPQVGPQSAGSEPGPASYDKGGEEPTVTDAMVHMGFIDPERYLGGRFRLDPAKAEAALQGLAERFDWSVEQASAAVHDLVVVNMANAVREVSVEKGHDPREFVFIAYGGTLPMFAMQIAGHLGISNVVIPQNSSVFSAMGLLSSDFVARYDRTVAWDLSRGEKVGAVNEVAAELLERGLAEMRAEGFSDDQIEVRRSADFRFLGQSYELSMGLPDRPLAADDAPRLAEQFFELYERTYGEGTAWKGVPEQLFNYTVTVIGKRGRSEGSIIAKGDGGEVAPSTGRRIFVPSMQEYRDVDVYLDEQMTVGSTIEGPAIIDATDTTIYVPPDASARRDEYLNYILSTNGGAR